MSALRQAESALRESETRLRAVIGELAEGVLTLDEKRVILDANPAAAVLLGTDAAALPGRAVTDVLGICLRDDGTPLSAAEDPVAAGLRSRDRGLAAVGLAGLGAMAALQRLASWAVPTPARYAATLPLGMLVLAGATARGALERLVGLGPKWRGRRYPLAR